MAFAPFDPLISVKTNVAVLRSRFDTLPIDRTRRWLRLSLLATPLRMTQLLHPTRHPPPATPPPEIAINCIPGVEILGQHTPLTAGLIDIETRACLQSSSDAAFRKSRIEEWRGSMVSLQTRPSIDDLAYVAWRASWSAGMPFLLRKQRFQDRPWLIAQIRCIVIRGTPDRHPSR